jgi:hypothetical protein
MEAQPLTRSLVTPKMTSDILKLSDNTIEYHCEQSMTLALHLLNCEPMYFIQHI